MVIKNKLGRLSDFDTTGKNIETVALEWYETGKRILHKKSNKGREILLKFLNEAPRLAPDDVIYEDADTLVLISILPCEVMVIIPSTMYEAAYVAYEIGNKHLPLFCQDGELLIPYDAPSFRLLEASGFVVKKESRTLSEPLRTTVNPHGHSGNSSSLFSRILQFTNTPPNE